MLVCYDGTIFDENQLQKLSEFGFKYRDKSGILCEYNLYLISFMFIDMHYNLLFGYSISRN